MSRTLFPPRLSNPLFFLLCHFEKILLGLALAICALSLAPTEDPTAGLQELDHSMRQVRHHMSTQRPQPAPLLDRPQALEDRLAPAPPAKSLPAWTLHRRPGVLAEGRRVEEVPAVHEAPTLEATLEGEVVKLRWTLGRRSEFLTTDLVLERREGEGEWLELARPEASQGEHRDDSLAPRRRYAYRLRSEVALDPAEVARLARRRQKATLAPEAIRRTSAPSEALSLAPRVRLELRQVWPADALAGRTGAAYFLVSVREGEGWRKHGFRVEVGREIGGAVANGRRRVDYASGATLLEVGEETRELADGRRIARPWARIQWAGGDEELLRSPR